MIIFKSVTKRFGDDTPPAVNDVSFEISTGELVVITGRSGSGKTTLMRLLTREYVPNEGEIVFENRPLSEIQQGQVHHHRRRIGVIFQDYKLLPEMNIWENIALPLYITGKPEPEIEQRVTDLLRLVELEERAFHFPSQLSGGESQRVSIARALATGPGVIFADEPTGNLDQETTKTIAKLLQKIHELGTTVLLTTHDLSVLDMLKGERVLTLDKGALISDTKKVAAKLNTIKKTPPTPETTPDVVVASEPAVKVETNPLVHKEEMKQEKPTTKAPRFQLPKFSLPFGKKKEPDNVEVKVETL